MAFCQWHSIAADFGSLQVQHFLLSGWRSMNSCTTSKASIAARNSSARWHTAFASRPFGCLSGWNAETSIDCEKLSNPIFNAIWGAKPFAIYWSLGIPVAPLESEMVSPMSYVQHSEVSARLVPHVPPPESSLPPGFASAKLDILPKFWSFRAADGLPRSAKLGQESKLPFPCLALVSRTVESDPVARNHTVPVSKNERAWSCCHRKKRTNISVYLLNVVLMSGMLSGCSQIKEL